MGAVERTTFESSAAKPPRSERDTASCNSSNFHQLETVVAIGILATSISILIHLYSTKCKKKQFKPIFLRAAIMPPLNGDYATAWRRILTFGQPADFVVIINITKEISIDKLPPVFSRARQFVNNGSPYHTNLCRRGKKPLLNSVDILGLCLWYLEYAYPLEKYCTIFGVVPTTARAWLNYGL